jgi:hypothetical protein
MTASESDVNFGASAEVSTYRPKDQDILASSLCLNVLALLSYLGGLDVSRFFGLRSKARSFGLIGMQDIFIAKFHGLMTIYKGVLSNLNWQDIKVCSVI